MFSVTSTRHPVPKLTPAPAVPALERSLKIYYNTMTACELKPEDKKKYVSDVVQRLVRDHGKKKYYKPEQIKKASRDGGYQPDIVCWAYCMFSSPSDFAAIHEATGEICDYASMKAEVLSDLASDGSFLGIDIDLSWLEWPDIDLSSVFDWFDFS